MSNALEQSFSDMILSASGWRKVFASSGNEEDRTSDISFEDKLICTAVAKTVVEAFSLKKDSTVLLGRDARPTGKTICDILGSVFLFLGVRVSYAGICAAPEIMAESSYSDFSLFAYVSASHNPIGHNGFKFGKDGGVFPGEVIKPVIARLRENVKDYEALCRMYEQSQEFSCNEDKILKEKCLKDYSDFVLKTACPFDDEKEFRQIVLQSGIGIVCDMNGSARSLSIDKEFLTKLGIKTAFINDAPGQVAHGIVPEGRNLEPCAVFLEHMHDKDSSFILGYVPDNDGDRGNLVYIGKDGKAHIPAAQDCFALCVKATLDYFNSHQVSNVAVAVNCSTSQRISDIASQSGAKVFRSEVGEANVVSLADSLRKRGYSVPILGEGSNGGNITYPAKVRDPMNTLMCLVRLFSRTSIADALAALDVYTTTDAFSPEATLHLKTQDYKALKSVYEDRFASQFESRKAELAMYGIVSYEEYQTEGIIERKERGKGDRGGLKMVFLNGKRDFEAFIWMRPSGTEPLFRILTDVKGDRPQLHDFLNNWQREMILSAQEEICR